MAINPETGQEHVPYWMQGLNWIAMHPGEFLMVICFIVIGYNLWKWLSKYWFHEIHLYRPELKVKRYLGRMIWAQNVQRNQPGQIYCEQCDTHFSDFQTEDDMKRFTCPNCDSADDLEMTRKPIENKEYMNIKIFEQIWPLSFKVISVEKFFLKYYKKKFLPLENFKKQKYYQRIGIRGINLYWNKDWGVHEIRNDYVKSQLWNSDEFRRANQDILTDTDKMVMVAMNMNPQIISQHIRETNIPLPPEE